MVKKKLSKTFVVLIILFFTFSLQIISEKSLLSVNAEDNTNYDVLLPQAKNENLKLKLEFIGFNQDLVNESEIESQLFDHFKHSTSIPQADLNFNFEFNYAEESIRKDLEDYINSTAGNGTDTGYELNITLLYEDLASGNRSDIFIPRDGMSIDAELVNEYLYQNLYQDPPVDEPGYTLFLMNFSIFDSPDHSLEHWYDTYGTSFDANETVTWWYSGYRNLPKRAAMGWGGKYRFAYIDLSSRSWYLDYVINAWSSFGIGYPSYYDYPDLDNLTQTHDITTPTGNAKLTDYLADWINSYIGNVFSGPCYDPPLGKSISLQVKVLNNLTDNGYPEEDLLWCISKHRILNQLDNDFPWIDWRIEIEWVELTDELALFDYIQANTHEDIDGKYIEVSSGLFSILQNELSSHFDMSAADEVLPCYFFLTDNVAFRWYGTSFAGLGGMGWEILKASQYSLFEEGNISKPMRGMSAVMIHELGHSLGLPHPHSSYGWGSSFVEEVMSYFSTTEKFSTFYKDAVGRAHADAHFLYAIDEFANAYQIYQDAGSPSEHNATIALINTTLNEDFPQYYRQMDYDLAAVAGLTARDLIQTLINDLQGTTEPTSPTTALGFLAIIVFPVIIFVSKAKRRKI
ncbi:MAG: hypothetical protein E3J70_06420 [Candidatus Heimdallarchaeota archaeon]|nr:MAG: hypothetical protein E3J70_06420 [Candidatus Heimdallarchaeota archaeon]